MTFGQKMKVRRQELGYTQEELAQKVHTTQPYVSRLEKGGFNPSMKMIKSIADALRISTDYLLFDDRAEDSRKVECDCWHCPDNAKCKFCNKFQRLPRESGGLGLCPKLHENRQSTERVVNT